MRKDPLDALLERALRCFTAAECSGSVRAMERLVLFAQSEPSAFVASLYEPVLCLILRGRKQVSIGEQTFSFGPGECLLVSHDLPVRSRITSARSSARRLRSPISRGAWA